MVLVLKSEVVYSSEKAGLHSSPCSPFRYRTPSLDESKSSASLETEGYLLVMRAPIRRNRASASVELPLTQTVNHLVETLPVVLQWGTTEKAAKREWIAQYASELCISMKLHFLHCNKVKLLHDYFNGRCVLKKSYRSKVTYCIFFILYLTQSNTKQC